MGRLAGPRTAAAMILIAMIQLVLSLLEVPVTFGADQVVLRFHNQPQISGPVVRFKDIVEIVSGSAPSFDKLREMSLGPAPREGQVQTWHSSDVLQHLELRGIHPKGIRWMGADSTKLTGVKAVSSAIQEAAVPAFVDDRILLAAENNLATALKDYLNLKARSQIDWRIKTQVSAQQARMLQSRRSILSISGGEEPWTGEQEFNFQVRHNGQASHITVKAQIDTPPMIVVANGPLRRDQLITASMLSYAPLPRNVEESKYFVDINSLVGKQLRRSLSSGQPITDEFLGEPIVIGRNELIEVESISGPVVVTTSGKSLGAGSVGDLIEVEMQDRKKLKAVVVGTGRARIAAVSAVASSK